MCSTIAQVIFKTKSPIRRTDEQTDKHEDRNNNLTEDDQKQDPRTQGPGKKGANKQSPELNRNQADRVETAKVDTDRADRPAGGGFMVWYILRVHFEIRHEIDE